MRTWLKSAWQAVKAKAREIGSRAFHTWWQAFAASLAVAWASSGLDVSQVTDVDSAKRVLLALALAVGAAALSAVKTTWLAIRSDPAAYVGEHETPTVPTIPTQGA